MKTAEDKCTEKARMILPWGGKLLNYCPVHANQIVMIGNAIGNTIQIQLLPKDSEKVCESLSPLTDEEKELAKSWADLRESSPSSEHSGEVEETDKELIEFASQLVNPLGQSSSGEGVEQAAEKWAIDFGYKETDEFQHEIELAFIAGASWDAGKKDAVDYKAKYEKCIDIIKRFQGHGIIGMYDL